MVGYPFKIKKSNSLVSYGTGNPMGFYSSWASFAVAHHYVMFYCCKKLNIEFATAKYVLLGDDILIGDDNLAQLYKSTITGLGVEFSSQKTYTSRHFSEFAKRLQFKGDEISPFPISGLNEVSNKYYLFNNFINETINKGWIPIDGAPACVASYLGIVQSLPSSVRKKIKDKAQVSYNVMLAIRNPDDAGRLISEAFRILGYSITVSTFVALNVLENIAVDLYAQNNPFSNMKNPLFDSDSHLLDTPSFLNEGLLTKYYDIPTPSTLFVRANPL